MPARGLSSAEGRLGAAARAHTIDEATTPSARAAAAAAAVTQKAVTARSPRSPVFPPPQTVAPATNGAAPAAGSGGAAGVEGAVNTLLAELQKAKQQSGAAGPARDKMEELSSLLRASVGQRPLPPPSVGGAPPQPAGPPTLPRTPYENVKAILRQRPEGAGDWYARGGQFTTPQPPPHYQGSQYAPSPIYQGSPYAGAAFPGFRPGGLDHQGKPPGLPQAPVGTGPRHGTPVQGGSGARTPSFLPGIGPGGRPGPAQWTPMRSSGAGSGRKRSRPVELSPDPPPSDDALDYGGLAAAGQAKRSRPDQSSGSKRPAAPQAVIPSSPIELPGSGRRAGPSPGREKGSRLTTDTARRILMTLDSIGGGGPSPPAAMPVRRLDLSQSLAQAAASTHKRPPVALLASPPLAKKLAAEAASSPVPKVTFPSALPVSDAVIAPAGPSTRTPQPEADLSPQVPAFKPPSKASLFLEKQDQVRAAAKAAAAKLSDTGSPEKGQGFVFGAPKPGVVEKPFAAGASAPAPGSSPPPFSVPTGLAAPTGGLGGSKYDFDAEPETEREKELNRMAKNTPDVPGPSRVYNFDDVEETPQTPDRSEGDPDEANAATVGAASAPVPETSPEAPEKDFAPAATTIKELPAAFLQKNQQQAQAAQKAIEDEIEKEKKGGGAGMTFGGGGGGAAGITFGASAPKPTFAFGATAAPAKPADDAAAQPPAKKPFVFGAPAAEKTAGEKETAGAAAPFVFGAAAATPQGNDPIVAKPLVFGEAPTSDKPAAKAAPPPMFGGAMKPATAVEDVPPAGVVDGEKPAAPSPFVFGAGNPDSAQPKALFGAAPGAADGKPAAPSPFVFGGAAKTSGEAEETAPKTLGATPGAKPDDAKPAAAPAPFVFGASAAKPEDAKPAAAPAPFVFGASAAKPAAPAVPAEAAKPAAPYVFGGGGSPAGSTPAAPSAAPAAPFQFGGGAAADKKPAFGGAPLAFGGSGSEVPATPAFGAGTTEAPAPTPVFGSSGGAAAATPAFGAAASAAPTPSVFGAPGGAAAGAPAAPAFGSAVPAAPAFGAAPAAPANPFGASTPAFGVAPAAAPAFGAATGAVAQPAFGGAAGAPPAAQAFGAPAATASAFGAAPVAPAFGSTAAAAPPAFGAAPAAPAAFGGAPPAPGGGGPAFNIGASSTPAGQGRKKLVAKRPWRRK